MFGNQAYFAKQVPGAKYKINFDSVEKHSRSAKLHKITQVRGQNVFNAREELCNPRFKKSKDPTIGSYKEQEAIEKT
jgi:hypothetical protein